MWYIEDKIKIMWLIQSIFQVIDNTDKITSQKLWKYSSIYQSKFNFSGVFYLECIKDVSINIKKLLKCKIVWEITRINPFNILFSLCPMHPPTLFGTDNFNSSLHTIRVLLSLVFLIPRFNISSNLLLFRKIILTKRFGLMALNLAWKCSMEDFYQN